jgi:hypothetical protein
MGPRLNGTKSEKEIAGKTEFPPSHVIAISEKGDLFREFAGLKVQLSMEDGSFMNYIDNATK